MKGFFVMTGGFVGAISRYGFGEWIDPVHGFPLGTLLINLIGCFLLGWFLTYVSRSPRVKPEVVLMIGTGFIGSFTTFSTFSVETIRLVQAGSVLLAVLYVLLSTLAGLLLAEAGRRWALSGGKEGGKG
ncbi:fluoride efflux transporter CrcB [Pseudobacillus badius]|uniref:fluoride efflux transporter CrcB n=1 Tax=Bacillus badius TaxID=1455 RepID=UPI0024A060E5|nr:fluoride efflux transporter CrcB [Bacillus badius]GLY09478.1 hypothetical protein Bbad01_06940 [Bacillus badius]